MRVAELEARALFGERAELRPIRRYGLVGQVVELWCVGIPRPEDSAWVELGCGSTPTGAVEDARRRTQRRGETA